jgi:hypothetical protein
MKTLNKEVIQALKQERYAFDNLEDVLNDNSVLFDNTPRKPSLYQKAPNKQSKPKSYRKKADANGLFDKVKHDLKTGKKHLIDYKGNRLYLNQYYSLRGQLLYVESMQGNRVHVYYDNGTENYPEVEGLIAQLYGNGNFGKIVA